MCFRPPISVIVTFSRHFHTLSPLSIIRVEPAANAIL
jgi:hypothetical protein